MRSFFGILILLLTLNTVNAQKILGTYEQTALVAPDAYRDSENDVVITQDTKSNKKIWVQHLIPNQKFYAVLYLKSDNSIIYSVPKQKVGNYLINIGCITLNSEEDEEKENLIISLNNKANCFGMSQKDYDKPIKVDKNGVEAGGVKVGSKGEIKTEAVDISKGGVKVDTKSIMAGIQYVGNKKGTVKKKIVKEEDEDN